MSAIATALEPTPHAAADRFDGLAWTQAARGLRLGGPGRDAGELEEKLAEARATIADQQERIAYLESLSMTDELTGLLNRRGFYSHFRRELAAARRSGAAGGVLLIIDLDGFKGVNDTHGHLAGDAFLRHVARRIAGQVRQQDVVARLGGDEFAVLLTDTDAEAGAARVRQLTELAAGEPFHWNGAVLPVRFSRGFQPYGAEDHEDEVIRRADAEMYGNKGERRQGRRRGAEPGALPGAL